MQRTQAGLVFELFLSANPNLINPLILPFLFVMLGSVAVRCPTVFKQFNKYAPLVLFDMLPRCWILLVNVSQEGKAKRWLAIKTNSPLLIRARSLLHFQMSWADDCSEQLSWQLLTRNVKPLQVFTSSDLKDLEKLTVGYIKFVCIKLLNSSAIIIQSQF